MRIQAKCPPDVFNAFNGFAVDDVQLAKERPGIRVIGVEAECRRQLRSPLIELAIEHQYIGKKRMGCRIVSIERHRSLRCRSCQWVMAFDRLSIIDPSHKVTHCEPRVRVRKSRIKLD